MAKPQERPLRWCGACHYTVPHIQVVRDFGTLHGGMVWYCAGPCVRQSARGGG